VDHKIARYGTEPPGWCDNDPMRRSVVCDEFDGNGNVWRGDVCIIQNVPYRVVVSQEVYDVPFVR
jgi:hypothetical protein